MKRAWRFIKWFISKSTWTDFVIFTTGFTLAAGFTAGEGTVRIVFWTIALGVNILFIVGFMTKGFIRLWQDFKKHDEKIFNILKQEKIK
jgi:hypothetical protein